EAGGIFILWLVQFIFPDSRQVITVINFGWAAFEILRATRSKTGFRAFRLAPRMLFGKR
ncbi:MAG: hypothetical protein IT349_21150, partial [Candidatus Eisenbacteria bacterium]|nr:hypothetical protein [Candidatus Eisenbacteria bacterium]